MAFYFSLTVKEGLLFNKTFISRSEEMKKVFAVVAPQFDR